MSLFHSSADLFSTLSHQFCMVITRCLERQGPSAMNNNDATSTQKEGSCCPLSNLLCITLIMQLFLTYDHNCIILFVQYCTPYIEKIGANNTKLYVYVLYISYNILLQHGGPMNDLLW